MITASPLEVEALAVFHAFQLLNSYGQEKCTIVSNYKVLIKTVQSESLADLPYWSAAETVMQCIHQLRGLQETVQLKHANREKIIPAHYLANWARRTGGTFIGLPGGAFGREIHLQDRLDPQSFKLQADREGIGRV